MLLGLSTFLAVTVGVAGLYSLITDVLLRNRLLVRERLETEFHASRRERLQQSMVFKTLESVPPPLADLDPGSMAAPVVAQDPGYREHLDQMIELTGARIRINQLLLLAIAVALAAGCLAGMFLGPVVGVVTSLATAPLPFIYLHFRWKMREEKLMKQLPDAFDLMARVLRAGHSVPQALQGVVEEFEAPIATEFAYCHEQQNLGMLPELTFRAMARRTGVLEIKIFVMAMLIQRQTGGNLSDLLERLAYLVRERMRIRGHIKALTGEGRLQAVILLLLPPVMFGVLMFMHPTYARQLFDHMSMVVAMIVSMTVGAVWIHHIVNFEI